MRGFPECSAACGAAVLLCHACILILSADLGVSWSPLVERRLHQTSLGVLVSCVMHEAAPWLRLSGLSVLLKRMLPVLRRTCGQLSKISWRSQVQQELLGSCVCLHETLANVVFAVADEDWFVQTRKQNLVEFVKHLQVEVEMRATPVSMGELTTSQWLEMKSVARVADDLDRQLRVTGVPDVPGYNWGDSDERSQGERWDPCMSMPMLCGGVP